MTNVSPSSQKVDDFLSSLSQLSQERLKDNQDRQRRLQRDIDELRRTPGTVEYVALRPLGLLPATPLLSHGIRELSFNRSARGLFYEKWKDVGPELPHRPESASPLIGLGATPASAKTRPLKPTKPNSLSTPGTPPRLPQRPRETQETIESVKIDLIRPVARQPRPVKPASSPAYSTPKLSSQTEASGPLSFVALEEKIRFRGTKILEDALETLPQMPPRNKTLILDRLPKAAPSVPTKPVQSKPQPAPLSSLLLLPQSSYGSPLSKSEPLKPQLKSESKPPAPTKPKTLRAYEEDNTELLKHLLRQLSPAKPVREKKPPPGQFVPEDHIKQLQERRQRPEKPLKLKPTATVPEDKPEALSLKLKPTKPAPPKLESKPEALRQFETMRNPEVRKPEKPEIEKPEIQKPESISGSRVAQLNLTTKEPALPSDLSFKPVPAAQFHEHLTNLLRANTDPLSTLKPQARAPKQAPVRRATAPVEYSAPLTHPNKSRSKGPKRRLPKSQTTSSSVSTFASAASASSTSRTSSPAFNRSQPPKKKPPPIKGKKPDMEVKPRRIASGELFI